MRYVIVSSAALLLAALAACGGGGGGGGGGDAVTGTTTDTGGQNGGGSNPTPDTTAPTFTGLSAAVVGNSTSVQLSWPDASDDVTSFADLVYDIYYATSTGGQDFSTPGMTTAAGITVQTISGLTAGSDYYFVVRARDAAGNRDGNSVERWVKLSLLERVSVSSISAESNDGSFSSALSGDGRYVAFESLASNLVAGDTNGVSDIFVRDRQTGVTTRMSVDSSGTQGNGSSYRPVISGDGRYAAFSSLASNLVSGDTNGFYDVFVHDRQTGATTRVSVSSSGGQGDADSYNPSVSSDGRFIAFVSDATNLVTGDTNGAVDIFLHDRQTGTTSRISVDSAGGESDDDSYLYSFAISGDGRYIVFESAATNLVADDTNGRQDIFLRDTQAATTTRISLSTTGNQADTLCEMASISSDGRVVVFASSSSGLVSGDTNALEDIFARELSGGTTTRVNVSSAGEQSSGGISQLPVVSGDGRYVSYQSLATNLVSSDTNGLSDVFLHDRQTGITTRLSADASGTQANSTSFTPAVSSDGRYISFESAAFNLVVGDTNAAYDIFVSARR